MEQCDNALRLASEASEAAAKLKKNVNVLEKQCERQVVKLEVGADAGIAGLDPAAAQKAEEAARGAEEGRGGDAERGEEPLRRACAQLPGVHRRARGAQRFQEAEFGKSMKSAEEKAKALKKAAAVPAEHEGAS
eukprot:6212120-Pleurochrysis_carterae.AAC.2